MNRNNSSSNNNKNNNISLLLRLARFDLSFGKLLHIKREFHHVSKLLNVLHLDTKKGSGISTLCFPTVAGTWYELIQAREHQTEVYGNIYCQELGVFRSQIWWQLVRYALFSGTLVWTPPSWALSWWYRLYYVLHTKILRHHQTQGSAFFVLLLIIDSTRQIC